MSHHTATIPTYVRTAAGIVRVDRGERVPDDALPTEITRLAAAGALAEPEPHQEAAPSGPAPEASTPAPSRPATARRGRGQSGTTKEGN